MSRQDQIFVTCAGVISLILLGNMANIPVWQSLITGAGLIVILSLYAAYSRKAGAQPLPDLAVKRVNEALVSGDFPLAEGFAEAIITIGSKGELVYGNPAAQKLLNLRRTGMSYTIAIRQPDVIAAISEALNGNTPDPVTYVIEGNISRHIRATATPIKTEHELTGPLRVLVVFYDITDLVVANTKRSDFLANASHELKTPVASILGYIETLRGHARNDKAARERFLVIMQQQAERMQRLINDLLSLRKIEQIEHLAPTGTADMGASVTRAIESVMPLAKERGVDLHFDPSGIHPVIGQEDELVQVCLNLIDNAVKMTPRDGVVSVKLHAETQWRPGQEYSPAPIAPDALRRRVVGIVDATTPYVILRIRDQGPGFDREHLPRLGERFYRITGDRNSQDKGTGLGLAIVKHIIRRHRGGLFIESALKIGTEFSLFVPSATENTHES